MAPRKIDGKLIGKNGKPKSLTESINEKVNADEKRVEEIEERDKPKQENSSSDKSEDGLEFSEKEKAETLKFILERFPKRPGRGRIPTMHLSYGSSKGHQKELEEKRKLREAWNNTVAEESKNSVKPEKQQEEVKDENESTKEATTTVDPEDILKQLEAAKKKIEELSKANQSLRSDNSILNESIKQRAEEDAKKSQETKEEPKTEEVKTDNSDGGLSSERDVDAELREIFKAVKEGRISDAQKLADQAAEKYGSTSEPKVDNSAKTEETKIDTSEPRAANSENFEETVAPETGEAKVEGEPKANTEQAQATQEPAKEANARPGTGEATKDNVMSPEDAFKFFNDKKNYKEHLLYLKHQVLIDI
jgi:hypothetical protein